MAQRLLSTDAVALRIFERKVVIKIFNPVRVGDDFLIWFNNELYELFKDIDVVQCINIQCINIQFVKVVKGFG